MSQNSHLKIGSTHTNDVNIFLNDAETLQITRTGTEVRYQAHGGTGQHRFMNDIYGNGDIDIATGKQYKINGTALAKGDIGLGNVDNTTDTAKPISTTQQAAIDLKANLASPALTGNPTAPTQSASDNSTKIATTAYADAAAGSSPTTEVETRTIRIIAGSASTDYAIANTDWLVIIKHTASGITATLPTNASDKQIIYIKNSCGASNNTLDVMAGSGHTIDYTFSGVRLNGTSTSSASVDTQVNQCFKAMYLTTNTTWVRLNDGY